MRITYIIYLHFKQYVPSKYIDRNWDVPEAKSVRLQISRAITLQQGQGVVLRQSSARNQAVNLQRLGPHKKHMAFEDPKVKILSK